MEIITIILTGNLTYSVHFLQVYSVLPPVHFPHTTRPSENARFYICVLSGQRPNNKKYAFSCSARARDGLQINSPLHYLKIILSIHFQQIVQFYFWVRFRLIHIRFLRRNIGTILIDLEDFIRYLITSPGFTHDCQKKGIGQHKKPMCSNSITLL